MSRPDNYLPKTDNYVNLNHVLTILMLETIAPKEEGRDGGEKSVCSVPAGVNT